MVTHQTHLSLLISVWNYESIQALLLSAFSKVGQGEEAWPALGLHRQEDHRVPGLSVLQYSLTLRTTAR